MTHGPDPFEARRRYDSMAVDYDRHLGLQSSRLGRYQEGVRKRAVAELQLKPGQTVIDVGCGTGASFARLIAAVGRDGRVVGVDQSRGMLAVATKRIANEGWTNVELIEAPVQDANLPDADAAIFFFTHDRGSRQRHDGRPTRRPGGHGGGEAPLPVAGTGCSGRSAHHAPLHHHGGGPRQTMGSPGRPTGGRDVRIPPPRRHVHRGRASTNSVRRLTPIRWSARPASAIMQRLSAGYPPTLADPEIGHAAARQPRTSCLRGRRRGRSGAGSTGRRP
jgi:SAM-dependent methyltransferase